MLLPSSLNQESIKEEYQKFREILAKNTDFEQILFNESLIFIKTDQNQSTEQQPKKERPQATKIQEPVTAPTHSSPAERRLIDERIAQLRDSQQNQYKRIKDLYYLSLSESSRKTISSLEKRMRPDLFNQQLQGHITQYIVEQGQFSEVKQILFPQ